MRLSIPLDGGKALRSARRLMETECQNEGLVKNETRKQLLEALRCLNNEIQSFRASGQLAFSFEIGVTVKGTARVEVGRQARRMIVFTHDMLKRSAAMLDFEADIRRAFQTKLPLQSYVVSRMKPYSGKTT